MKRLTLILIVNLIFLAQGCSKPDSGHFPNDGHDHGAATQKTNAIN